MATTLKGGCMCGAVRYECTADPIFMANCNCRDCQRAGGGAYAPSIWVPKMALKVTGEAKFNEITGGSGNPIARGFCPNCGARLFVRLGLAPDLMVDQAASLDDPALYKPMLDIFTASAQPWDQLSPKTTKFPQAPPQR